MPILALLTALSKFDRGYKKISISWFALEKKYKSKLFLFKSMNRDLK